jgi:hypothetical protein
MSLLTYDMGISPPKEYCESYCTEYKQQSTLEYNYIKSDEYIEELILKHQDILP